MTTSEELSEDAILKLLERMHPDEDRDPTEGLRERKKRRVRQKISDVATAMFLIHGFDDVTVAQIARAADVSQQTVFNYFPTKESMFFDRADPMIHAVADAVRERRGTTLVETVVQAITGKVQPNQREAMDETGQLQLSRRFCEVATKSPTLVAARYGDLPRFIDQVSIALAHRIDAEPLDPEVQFTTLVIAGLVRVRLQSTFHHVQHATSFAELNADVRRDILRAAQLAEPSLAAFDNMGISARAVHRPTN